MPPVSAQTRANRVTAGRKAAATRKARQGWRERSLEAVAAGVGASSLPVAGDGAGGAAPAAYRPPSIKSLLRRIRRHSERGG